MNELCTAGSRSFLGLCAYVSSAFAKRVDDTERVRVSCQVPVGEPLVLSEARRNTSEDRYYFELTAMNGCKGWVPETFVRLDADVRR